MDTGLVSQRWTVGGVLTDVTTAKLSDPTGAYGIKRNDTDAVVVSDGTAMTKVAVGTYEYTFTQIAGVAYTAYVELVYGGVTYHLQHDIPAAPAATTSFQLGYDDFRMEIADFLGWTRDSGEWSANDGARLDAIIRSGLLRVYYPERVKPELVHQWSWMRPVAEIETVAAYSTGTIEIASGVVTLVTGTWPSWAASGELTVASETYSVASRDSDSQITLDDTSVDVSAGSSYSLGRPSYSLPADFDGSFDGQLCYQPGTNVLWPPIEIVSDLILRRKRQHDTQADRPLFAAIRPATFDPTAGQQWEVTFYPTPNGAYKLFGRYKVRPSMLDSINKYPMGGTAMSEVFLESCLAVAEQRFRDAAGSHTQTFMTLLAAAIANDAEAFAPDVLGYNADRSDERHSDRYDEHAGVAIHSFNGVYY